VAFSGKEKNNRQQTDTREKPVSTGTNLVYFKISTV
jgi:hypothetical protein